MMSQTVRIIEEKCTGCGKCAEACQEGAIQMVNGKAKVVHEDYCDGLGTCLPVCPAGAIVLEERYAEDQYLPMQDKSLCSPHKRIEIIRNRTSGTPKNDAKQWPVQIRLVPSTASYFNDADLLIAADCSAYSFEGFYERFVKGRTVLIGCPKLDNIDYSDKLSEILINNSIRNIMIVRMEVPCCSGLTRAVERALEKSGKKIPMDVVTISDNGKIL